MDPEQIHSILEKHRGSRGSLISILEEVQAKYGYLPEDALRSVADEAGLSLVDVYGVATFYKSFSLKPRGKHLVSLCQGTACHVYGSARIVKEFERQLGVVAGETTADKEITLETVNCLGACALGPIVVVDGHYFTHVSSSKVEKILEKVRSGLDEVEIEGNESIFPVGVSCSRCNHSLMSVDHPIDDHPSIRVTMSFGGHHGWLMLSSLYGSYKIEAEYEIPKDTVVNFFCPHCHAELIGASDCADCGAPMVPLIVRQGGMMQICSRRGCKGHMLDLDGDNL